MNIHPLDSPQGKSRRADVLRLPGSVHAAARERLSVAGHIRCIDRYLDVLVSLLGPGSPPVLTADRALPLAIGTGTEIVAAAPAGYRRAVRAALRRYCRSRAYLAALAHPRSQRHDLDASPTGEVDPAHRLDARRQLDAMRRRMPHQPAANANPRDLDADR